VPIHKPICTFRETFRTGFRDDDDKLVWLTWAVGALFSGARCLHNNRVRFSNISPVMEESVNPRDGLEATAVCRYIPPGFWEQVSE
jgi:hypothetical protein